MKDKQMDNMRSPQQGTMAQQREALTKKERNLISAKKNYLTKKKERADLEERHESLVTMQMTLIQDITFLQERTYMIHSFLQKHEYERLTSCAYHIKRKTHPKRKWNEDYLNEINNAKQQKISHPNVNIDLRGSHTLSVH